jgi:O6-methylguanine-DNA--protein-cysteine methyltransferase
MKKVIRLSESDLVRVVKRIVFEQYNMDQEELPKNKIANEIEYWLDEYKTDMENFLSELQSDGDVDKRRFMSRIKNGTNQIYQEIVNSLDGPKDPRMSMLDKTFAHKQQELYGYFLDKLN